MPNLVTLLITPPPFDVVGDIRLKCEDMGCRDGGREAHKFKGHLSKVCDIQINILKAFLFE